MSECASLFLTLTMSFNCHVKIYTFLSPSVGKKPSKAANFVDVFINALTCSEFQDMFQRAAEYFWSWLGAERNSNVSSLETETQCLPQNHFCAGSYSTGCAASFKTEIILKKHHINSVFHFHHPLSNEYLAFLHELCNTSVRHFFLESFATKTVYNACLSVLWQSLYCKCLFH